MTEDVSSILNEGDDAGELRSLLDQLEMHLREAAVNVEDAASEAGVADALPDGVTQRCERAAAHIHSARQVTFGLRTTLGV